MATALESSPADAAWLDFCERHAVAAAQDFSKSCMQYISMNMPESARAAVNHKELLKKFTESFAEHFETDFCKRRLANNKVVNGVSRHTEETNDCNSEIEDGSPKMYHKPFFRRYALFSNRKNV